MILLTGARGVVGQPLQEHLKRLNQRCLVVSREAAGESLKWDLSLPPEASVLTKIKSCNTLIHCAPIWVLPQQVSVLVQAGITRFVVFSSTSVIGKQHSASEQEQKLVQTLRTAEADLQQACSEAGVALTILRPSLIYGYGRDENVTRIANFIRRFKCLPLAGKAEGLRQPVHAEDLAQVAYEILGNSSTFNKIYNLSGGETLSYRVMVQKIFTGLQMKQRIINLPLPLYRLLLRALSIVGGFSYTAEMANRMNQDLVYDNQQAVRDFNYQPQAFLLYPERDLPASRAD